MDLTGIGNVLLVYGPLGVMALLGLVWRAQADKQIEKRQKEHEAALAQLVLDHRAELRQLTDRFVALVETYAGHYSDLLDKVAEVFEALPRASKR